MGNGGVRESGLKKDTVASKAKGGYLHLRGQPKTLNFLLTHLYTAVETGLDMLQLLMLRNVSY